MSKNIIQNKNAVTSNIVSPPPGHCQKLCEKTSSYVYCKKETSYLLKRGSPRERNLNKKLLCT